MEHASSDLFESKRHAPVTSHQVYISYFLCAANDLRMHCGGISGCRRNRCLVHHYFDWFQKLCFYASSRI